DYGLRGVRRSHRGMIRSLPLPVWETILTRLTPPEGSCAAGIPTACHSATCLDCAKPLRVTDEGLMTARIPLFKASNTRATGDNASRLAHKGTARRLFLRTAP